jgi:hypothetical protein
MDQLELRYRRQFLEMVKSIKDEITLTRVAELIERGRADAAINIIDAHVSRFASQVNQGFVIAGDSAAGAISGTVAVTFDQTNYRAVELMRANRLSLITEFTSQQRDAARLAMTEGIQRGMNPIGQARMFRDSIGLTARQQAAVSNYQRLLEQNSTEALTRQLRDKRFDRTVQSAIRNDRPLTSDQISRMVGRYRERYLRYRSETIARTEALSNANQGSHEMYQQAFDDGLLNPEELERRWNTRLDGNQRDSHDAMHGQTVTGNQPFISGDGNYLMYPGDRSVPAEDRIHCRCAVSTRLRRKE